MSTTLLPRAARATTRKRAMPFRILVATTGQPDSCGAIRVASLLARRTPAAVDVLTVVPPFPHLPMSGFRLAPPVVIDEQNIARATAVVRAQLATVRGTREWKVRAAAGWPAHLIVEAARRLHASLIVLGMGHHGALDRMVGSETAIAIAKDTNVPLLVVPEDVDRLPVHAAAAIDFTLSSESAARMAAELIPTTGVLTLLHASMPPQAPAFQKLDALADDIAAQTCRKVTTRVAEEPIVDALIATVEREHCDMIALGSHARGLIDYLLTVSVRARVLRKATCPVLVFPEWDDNTAEARPE